MVYYVYLISEIPFPDEKIGNWVKIGYSQNPPEWRMNANLKRGNPRDIYVAACFEYPTRIAALEAERSAHLRFNKYYKHKEWFNVRWQTVEKWLLSQGAVKRKPGDYRKTRAKKNI